MKKITAVFLCLCMLLPLLSGCGRAENKEQENEITLTLNSTVKKRLVSISVDWCIGEDTVSTQSVQNAKNDEYLDCGKFVFEQYESAFEGKKDLSRLVVRVSVTEKDGSTAEVAALALPSEYGDEYEYDLIYDGGSYSLFKVMK